MVPGKMDRVDAPSCVVLCHFVVGIKTQATPKDILKKDLFTPDRKR